MISSFWSRSIFDVSNILDFAAIFIVWRKHEDTIFGLVKPKETEIQFMLLWCDNVAISEDGLTTSQIFHLSWTFVSLSLLRFQQSGSSLPSSGSNFFLSLSYFLSSAWAKKINISSCYSGRSDSALAQFCTRACSGWGAQYHDTSSESSFYFGI